MNINQLLFNAAYNELLETIPDGLSEDDLKKYFVTEGCKPNNQQDVYIEFIRTASQNHFTTASIIKYKDNQTKISEILRQFDYEYVRSLTAPEKDEMSEQFKDLFNIHRGSEKERKREELLTRSLSSRNAMLSRLAGSVRARGSCQGSVLR